LNHISKSRIVKSRGKHTHLAVSNAMGVNVNKGAVV